MYDFQKGLVATLTQFKPVQHRGTRSLNQVAPRSTVSHVHLIISFSCLPVAVNLPYSPAGWPPWYSSDPKNGIYFTDARFREIVVDVERSEILPRATGLFFSLMGFFLVKLRRSSAISVRSCFRIWHVILMWWIYTVSLWERVVPSTIFRGDVSRTWCDVIHWVVEVDKKCHLVSHHHQNGGFTWWLNFKRSLRKDPGELFYPTALSSGVYSRIAQRQFRLPRVRYCGPSRGVTGASRAWKLFLVHVAREPAPSIVFRPMSARALPVFGPCDSRPAVSDVTPHTESHSPGRTTSHWSVSSAVPEPT